MKKFFLFTLAFFMLNFLMAQTTVSTFHCISLYWSPVDGHTDKKVTVLYRVSGTNDWKPGLAMKYQPIANCGLNPITNERYDKADYRGSIVDLTPGTDYDIRMSLEGTNISVDVQASTWDETFPIGQTIVVGDMSTRYNVPSSGTPNAYVLIDGTGSTIDIQDGSPQCIRLIDKSYVILRGFTLMNAGKSGIRLFNSHHIVIEDCDISGWGEEDIAGTGFGKGYQSGVYAGTNEAWNMVIQRNKIHHPRWDTNSWAELHDPNSDPNNNSNYHPDGPQGIALGQCYIGNNVIRYNEIWSDSEHYFNDILGMWENGSYAGFPGADSDIYGNYFANCWDDGIESEGSNTNVRIFANYIENNLIPIANAATSIGPLYIWKNVAGRSYSLPGSVYGVYGPFLKLGYAGSVSWMTGQTYVFNNTILQPNGEGPGGLGTSNGSNRHIKHFVSRNNILHVRNVTTNSISTRSENEDIDYDFDLMNKGYPVSHEANGIPNATPIYSVPAPSLDFVTKTGDFRLASNSPGFDVAEIIPNFVDTYNGIGPDVGAHEAGTDPMVFGVNSVYPIPLHPLPLELISFYGELSGDMHKLFWEVESKSIIASFQLEYSENKQEWKSLLPSINAVNQLGVHLYSLKHNPTHQDNYYRLKVVDFDGSFSYSDIVYLKGNSLDYTIIPNPTSNRLSISNVQQGEYIVIINCRGEKVLEEKYNGDYIDILQLVRGSYFVQLNNGVVRAFIIER